MTIKEQIEVMQHFENGGKVEWRHLGVNVWSGANTPIWNWQDKEYRIKEISKKTKIVFEYLVKCVRPNAWATCGYFFTEEEALANFSSPYMKTGRQFEVEV